MYFRFVEFPGDRALSFATCWDGETFPFQEFCKIPSRCFGTWRVTIVKNLIFLSFFLKKNPKNTEKHSSLQLWWEDVRSAWTPRYIPSHGMPLVWHLTKMSCFNSFKKDQLNCKDECNVNPSCKMACLPYSSAEGIYWQRGEWGRSWSICGLNQITGGTGLCIPESRMITCPYMVPGEQIEVIHLNK